MHWARVICWHPSVVIVEQSRMTVVLLNLIRGNNVCTECIIDRSFSKYHQVGGCRLFGLMLSLLVTRHGKWTTVGWRVTNKVCACKEWFVWQATAPYALIIFYHPNTYTVCPLEIQDCIIYALPMAFWLWYESSYSFASSSYYPSGCFLVALELLWQQLLYVILQEYVSCCLFFFAVHTIQKTNIPMLLSSLVMAERC